jgi:hypothetical protein
MPWQTGNRVRDVCEASKSCMILRPVIAQVLLRKLFSTLVRQSPFLPSRSQLGLNQLGWRESVIRVE